MEKYLIPHNTEFQNWFIFVNEEFSSMFRDCIHLPLSPGNNFTYSRICGFVQLARTSDSEP